MKTHTFGVITRFMTAYGNAMNHSEYFYRQDRGKFVKCDIISLASITKIKMVAHCLKIVLANFEELILENYTSLD